MKGMAEPWPRVRDFAIHLIHTQNLVMPSTKDVTVAMLVIALILPISQRTDHDNKAVDR